MPDKDVKTVKDLIFYQYAKIIVRRVLGEINQKRRGLRAKIHLFKISSISFPVST
jgi:hypothetical protein